MDRPIKRITIVKDWDWPDLRRQTPNGDGLWGDLHFSIDTTAPCDTLVVLNNRLEKPFTTIVSGHNCWALMQEPYAKGVTDWMAEGHKAFDKVFTNFIPNADDKYVRSQPAIPWHINMSYTELVNLPVPDKKRPLSWIVGNVKDLPGHIKRWNFLQALQNVPTMDIDLFGKAVRFIEYKNEGLLPYRYALAVENTCATDYWTEKIADCWLAWSVPIYYGCPNLEDFFPADAFIRIDIEDPEKAVAQLREVIAHDDWQKRLPAIAEARELVLNRYQLFPYLSELIRTHSDCSQIHKQVTVPAYRRSFRAYFWRRLYKLKKAVGSI